MADVHAPRMQQEMELAAFEKGRLQGELEATRRMENEHSKQLLPAHNAQIVHTEIVHSDVVEINRLTWLQRAAAFLGEGATIAQVVLTIVWLDEYRGDVSWRDSNDGGNVQFHNTHYLTNCLGLFFLANAITNYRMAPINMKPIINRLWYCFLQSAAVICFSLSLVSFIRSTPEREVWSSWQWVYCMAFAVTVLHSLYSIIVTLLEPMHHQHVNKTDGNYGNWSETGTHLETPEQKRDHTAYNHAARTIYAPAPVHVRGTNQQNNHANNHSAGAAAVPNAPANAPRWAENPATYSSHYWLLPRAKWAVVGFWAIGCAILMDLSASQQLIAAGNAQWASQINENSIGVDRTGKEMALLGATGILTLASLIMMAYVAMPPRTSIVKNGILVDPNNAAARRTSISHNAETRLGPNNV